jgi:hypothetical protein
MREGRIINMQKGMGIGRLLKFFVVAFLLFVFICYVNSRIIYKRREDYLKQFDSWEYLSSTIGDIGTYVLIQRFDYKELFVIGEFPPDSPVTAQICDIASIRRSPKAANIVISCDFDTGYIYAGFSNARILVEMPWSAKRAAMRNERVGRTWYFQNAKGDEYISGDTILLCVAQVSSDDLLTLKAQCNQSAIK